MFNISNITAPIIGLIILFFVSSFLFIKYLLLKRSQKKLTQENINAANTLKAKIEELKIVEGLEDKFAYSLSMQDLIDMISDSLGKLLKYTASAYIYNGESKNIFKCVVKEGISGAYVKAFKDKMLGELNTLQNLATKPFEIKDIIEGESLDSYDTKDPKSIILVPFTVSGKVIGIFGLSSSLENAFSNDTTTFLNTLISKASNAVSAFTEVMERESGRLAAVIDSMVDGVVMLDREFKISKINPMAEKFLGLKDKEAEFFDLTTIFEKNFPVEDIVSQVLSLGEVSTFHEVYVKSSFFSISVIPIKFKEQIISCAIVMHNESEERKIKELREDFTAMVVHELRAPMTIIRGSADMIIRESDKFTKEQTREFLDQIITSSEALLKLVDDLLDTAKIESGKFQIMMFKNNINSTAKETVSNFTNLAKEKFIDLLTDFDESIPEFNFDKEKVGQVITNLLSNAVKFTHRGDLGRMSDRGIIKVGTRVQADTVQVFVSDNGSGIPKEVKSQLFNKFVQMRESAVSNAEGTGLGLSIAKGIVEAHKGKIWVEDNVPKGSVFIFSLPLTHE